MRRFIVLAILFLLLTGQQPGYGHGGLVILGCTLWVGEKALEAVEEVQQAAKREQAKKNVAEAYKRMQASASCGRADNQYLLGLRYLVGTEPAKKDLTRAYMWLSLAAKGGHSTAAEMRDESARELTPGEIAKAKRLVNEWRPDPAQCEIAAARTED